MLRQTAFPRDAPRQTPAKTRQPAVPGPSFRSPPLPSWAAVPPAAARGAGPSSQRRCLALGCRACRWDLLMEIAAASRGSRLLKLLPHPGTGSMPMTPRGQPSFPQCPGANPGQVALDCPVQHLQTRPSGHRCLSGRRGSLRTYDRMCRPHQLRWAPHGRVFRALVRQLHVDTQSQGPPVTDTWLPLWGVVTGTPPPLTLLRGPHPDAGGQGTHSGKC